MTKSKNESENVELEIKIPKKRGRKPKKLKLEELGNNEVDIPKVPKKRGRKPKNLNKPVEVKVPKKRGRKPILSNVTANNKNLSENFMTRDNVLHLKISSSEANNNILLDSLYNYDPEINNPEPYDPNNFSSKSLTNQSFIDENLVEQNPPEVEHFLQKNNENTDNIIGSLNGKNENLSKEINYDSLLKTQDMEVENVPQPKYNIYHNNDNNNILNSSKRKNNSIMVLYSDHNKRKEWPKSSSINCFWCCHTFKGSPYCLPTKIKNDVFYVYGNFCSKECSAAYNFNSGDNSYNIWERYTLLNHLYSIIDEDPDLKIKLAPPRMTLEMFGGNLSIEEFRESFTNNKKYKVVFPPMVSIIPSVNESNKSETTKKDTYYIPIDKERIKRVNNDLRLKRKNPINNNNTLENCMRLKYG